MGEESRVRGELGEISSGKLVSASFAVPPWFPRICHFQLSCQGSDPCTPDFGIRKCHQIADLNLLPSQDFFLPVFSSRNHTEHRMSGKSTKNRPHKFTQDFLRKNSPRIGSAVSLLLISYGCNIKIRASGPRGARKHNPPKGSRAIP